jgi:hypothetical protein
MRRTLLISAALLLCISGPSFGQEWVEFASRDDRFTCNFPTQPKVTETTCRSQHGADLPARVYSATQGQSRYSVTVVDYNQAQRILTERAKKCPAGAEACTGGPGATGEGYWKDDVRGAIVYASAQFIQRDVKVTSFLYNFVDLVEGHQLQLTSNKDKSRTFAGIYMHENKLYIAEATVPAGAPEPGLFQQSLGWLDENGIGLRYQSIYSNGWPAPPRVNRAGQGQGQGRIDAPGTTAGQGGQGR